MKSKGETRNQSNLFLESVRSEKMKVSFWVEVKGGVVILTHDKCGKTAEFNRVPFPGKSGKCFYSLRCPSERNCMYSGGLIISEQGYEKFLRQLKDLENGEKIIIQRELITVDSFGEKNTIHSQRLEVFERR